MVEKAAAATTRLTVYRKLRKLGERRSGPRRASVGGPCDALFSPAREGDCRWVGSQTTTSAFSLTPSPAEVSRNSFATAEINPMGTCFPIILAAVAFRPVDFWGIIRSFYPTNTENDECGH